MDTPSSSYFFRRLSTGYLYLVNGSFGLIGVFCTSALLKVLPVAFSSAVATEMSIAMVSSLSVSPSVPVASGPPASGSTGVEGVSGFAKVWSGSRFRAMTLAGSSSLYSSFSSSVP